MTGSDGRPTLAVVSVTAGTAEARNTIFAGATSSPAAVVRQSSASRQSAAAVVIGLLAPLLYLL